MMKKHLGTLQDATKTTKEIGNPHDAPKRPRKSSRRPPPPPKKKVGNLQEAMRKK